jgi:hypothetical protein
VKEHAATSVKASVATTPRELREKKVGIVEMADHRIVPPACRRSFRGVKDDGIDALMRIRFKPL